MASTRSTYAGPTGSSRGSRSSSTSPGRVTRRATRSSSGVSSGRSPMPDKTMTIGEVVGELRDGMTLGIGGWGSRRKPMALVRAIARSSLRDLTLVSYGGPDVGLLCATGKVRKVVFAFVSLDSIPLEPHFRAARQAGAVEALELDEGMVLLGLQAAAWRVPFLPTRGGLGAGVRGRPPGDRTLTTPDEHGETPRAKPGAPPHRWAGAPKPPGPAR